MFRVEWIGRRTLEVVGRCGRVLLLGAEEARWSLRPPFRFYLFLDQLLHVGVLSLPVVLITGAFTGMVLALQTASAFRLFANAKKVEIMNPEVLDFISQKNDFNAIASAPLILDTRALGYRIRYFLYHFAATGDFAWQDGDCLFEPLTPEDDAQAARWEKNRQKAFQGSPRHFLRMSRA